MYCIFKLIRTRKTLTKKVFLGKTSYKSNVKFENIHVNANSNSFKIVTRRKISREEEKITKFFKELFEEKFKKEDVNITKIISRQFTLTMNGI